MMRLKDILEKNVDESYDLSPDLLRDIRLTDPEVIKSDIKILGYVRNMKNQSRRIISPDGISPCLNAFTHGYAHGYVKDGNRIRRNTPREFFRMMGLYDNEIDVIQETGLSETCQYKLAGNSIVTNVLKEIFRNMFDGGSGNGGTVDALL